MNTPTNAYFTKFSSGLVLALLALSGFLFLIPIATPTHAASESPFTIAYAPQNIWYGGGETNWFAMNLTNPASNPYAISLLSFSAPSGWSIVGCSADDFGDDSYCTVNSGQTSAVFDLTESGADVGLIPGVTTAIWIEVTWGTGTYPLTSGSFITSFEANGAFAPGPSFKLRSFDPAASPSLSTTATLPFVAGGSAIPVTVDIGAPNAGVLVILSTEYLSGSFSGSGVTCYEGKAYCSVLTGANGQASVNFTPQNTIAKIDGGASSGNEYLYATLGGTTIDEGISPIGLDEYAYDQSAPLNVQTVAASPSAVSIGSIAADTASNGVDYSNDQATTVSTTTTGAIFSSDTVQFSLNDAFSNPVDLSNLATYTITLTANAKGTFDATEATAALTVVKCSNGGNWLGGDGGDITSAGSDNAAVTLPLACPSTTGPFDLPFDYYNGNNYGNTTGITFSLSGTLISGSFPTKTTVSNQLITSTFDTSSPIPSITTATPTAGKTVTVKVQLVTPQKGVPVTMYLDPASSFDTAAGSDYGTYSVLAAGFTNHLLSITNTTNSAGWTDAKFTVSTYAGATAYFLSNVTSATNANGASNALGHSDDSPGAVTQVGAVGSFVVNSYFVGTTPPTDITTTATNGTTIYINAAYADAYGNIETDCSAITNQISVNLAVSGVGGGGLVSANPVYVAALHCDTSGSFGTIAWTMPNAFGNVTLAANAVVKGHTVKGTDKITIVSPVPSLMVTSPTPLNNVIYSSKSFTTFNGWSAVSAGFQQSSTDCVSPDDCITSIDYTATSGTTTSSGSTFFSSANNATWSVTLTLPVGLSSVTFNATDANGFTVSSAKYTVLVDTSAPVAGFTTPQNANLTGGTSVSAWIYDTEGDLNASSVSVTDNGTAIASSQVAVSGTNHAGSNVTYPISITGLSTGQHNLVISASDYAGNSGSSSTLTVTVTVPPSRSFAVSGTPNSCTLGGFSGVCVNYQNLNPTTQSVVVFAVFKNSAGQTAGIGTSSATFNAGATQSMFIADPVGLASGSYSVSIFVFTTGNLPVSASTSISVTV